MASTVDGDRTQRRRPTRAIILIAILVAAALVGFAGIRDALQSSDARSALSDYLDDVQRGDYSGAYGQLCTAVLPGYSEADHIRFLEAQPRFSTYDLDNTTTTTNGDGTAITFSVHFTYAAGGISVVRMSVHLQDNGPRVCDGPSSRSLQ